jgi:hypothetical protein
MLLVFYQMVQHETKMILKFGAWKKIIFDRKVLLKVLAKFLYKLSGHFAWMMVNEMKKETFYDKKCPIFYLNLAGHPCVLFWMNIYKQLIGNWQNETWDNGNVQNAIVTTILNETFHTFFFILLMKNFGFGFDTDYELLFSSLNLN